MINISLSPTKVRQRNGLSPESKEKKGLLAIIRYLYYMKYLQAHNNGHDYKGYGNGHSELFRLWPSLCMGDIEKENNECQRYYIEQRKQTFVVYFGEEEHDVGFLLCF